VRHHAAQLPGRNQCNKFDTNDKWQQTQPVLLVLLRNDKVEPHLVSEVEARADDGGVDRGENQGPPVTSAADALLRHRRRPELDGVGHAQVSWIKFGHCWRRVARGAVVNRGNWRWWSATVSGRDGNNDTAGRDGRLDRNSEASVRS